MDAKQREEMSKRLEADMQRFLANGGKIYSCSHGETAKPMQETHTQQSERIFRETTVIKRDFKRIEEEMKAEMLGKVFGQLTVIGYAGLDKRGHRSWEVKCSCGDIGTASTTKLKLGIKRRCKSCGHKAASEKMKGNRNAKEKNTKS